VTRLHITLRFSSRGVEQDFCAVLPAESVLSANPLFLFIALENSSRRSCKHRASLGKAQDEGRGSQ